MDLVGACKAFVNVGERGSFTLGAAAARMPQPVASRRIAALEKHLGGVLFDRTGRGAALTSFGRDMMPSAKRLIALAEAMEYDAERARRTPMGLAVPDICAPRELALLSAEGRRQGIELDMHPAPPAERTELLRSMQVRAAIAHVPPDAARWSVPLGLACVAPLTARRVYIETLRVGRAGGERPRGVWIQPEDDVPHVRDRLTRVRDAVGLRPAQVAVAPTFTVAAAEALGSSDFLLCSPDQADQLGLHWRPIGEVELVRGFDVVGGAGDADRVLALLGDEIAGCLGASAGDEAAA